MKPKLLLRIAAILMFLHTIGHTFGALTWKNAPNAAVGQVIKEMETNHFEFMGRNTNIASFYEGYGYIMIAVLLFISVLLWKLSIEYNRGLIRLVAGFLIILSVIEYICFFPFAAAFSLLAGICAAVALFKYQKN
jgi:hypothetical protein